MTTENSEVFSGWSILELMGHRRLAGFVSEQEIAGAAFLRIDVPGDNGFTATQFYAPSAVYCITPTTEEIARRVAQRAQPAPVQRWELPAPEPRERQPYDREYPPEDAAGDEDGDDDDNA